MVTTISKVSECVHSLAEFFYTTYVFRNEQKTSGSSLLNSTFSMTTRFGLAVSGYDPAISSKKKALALSTMEQLCAVVGTREAENKKSSRQYFLDCYRIIEQAKTDNLLINPKEVKILENYHLKAGLKSHLEALHSSILNLTEAIYWFREDVKPSEDRLLSVVLLLFKKFGQLLISHPNHVVSHDIWEPFREAMGKRLMVVLRSNTESETKVLNILFLVRDCYNKGIVKAQAAATARMNFLRSTGKSREVLEELRTCEDDILNICNSSPSQIQRPREMSC